MLGETGDLPVPPISVESKPTTGFERKQLVVGRFTQPFLDRYPTLETIPGIIPEIHVSNPGQPEALVTLAGYKDQHTDAFLRDHGKKLLDRTNDTLITVGWSRFSDVVDLRWRCMADYLAENHPTGVKFFGTSFGGRESLVAMKKFKQLADLGFEVPVEAAVVVVAPTSKETVQPRKVMGTKTWLMLQAAQKIEPLITPISTLFPSIRAEAVRVRELIQGEQFKPGDFQEGQVVHYFGTDQEGTQDPLVNQPKAIEELRNAGVTVVEHWYKPDPKFAHYPAPEELDRMMEDALSVLGQADKIK